MSPDPGRLLYLQRLYLNGRTDTVAQQARADLAAGGDHPFLLNILACCDYEASNPSAAFQGFQKAVALEPASPRYQANLGVSLLGIAHPTDASRALRHALGLQPEDLRLARLALLGSSDTPASWLPVTAGPSKGHVFPLLDCGELGAFALDCSLVADRKDVWSLLVRDAATDSAASPAVALPRPGLPLLAALWNEAGLFLKTGLAGDPAVSGERRVLPMPGSPAIWIQRRRHLRILAGDFLRTDLALGGASTASPVRMRDFSASGLSYYAETPPAAGTPCACRVDFSGTVVEARGQVRSLRRVPSGLAAVGIEFTVAEAVTDRIARLVQEHRRRLKQTGN